MIKTKTNHQGVENFYNLEVSLNIQTERITVTILNGKKPNTSLDNEEDGKDAFFTSFPLSIILKVLADTARQKKGNKACTDREGRNNTWFTDDMCAQQNRNLNELITKSIVLARYHVTL